MKILKQIGLATAIATAGVSATALATDDGSGSVATPIDFGAWIQVQLRLLSLPLFGVLQPVGASSTASIDAATANANPAALVTVAKGLRAKTVTAAANAGPNIDMMAPWPDALNPTHLIACNEEGPAQPGVQRIRLSDGLVETILTGTNSCDPVRATAWGTIIVGEESGSTGQVLEIAKPLETTGVIFDRVTGTTTNGPGGTGAENVVTRWALGRLSFEGMALYSSGVMYYGDEKRPSQGTPGGAYFKFVPTYPWTGGTPITDLSVSPLTDGKVYALRLGKRSGNTDWGQGSNTGLGVWVPITPSFNVDLSDTSAALKITGYYRPEDIDIDRVAEASGLVRFCGNNTGNEVDDQNFGETVCLSDGTLAESLANTATPSLQLFVVGTPDFAMMDNIAYQPGRRNWVINEDGDGPAVGRNNDIFDCLPDRADDDRLSDGCVKVVTLNDLNAESTGGTFDATGKRYWVSIQHNVTGHGVVLEITGWK
jgi:hypothetical protein